MSSVAPFQEIFGDFVVVAIPTRTDFRGINIREAALFRGPCGWSEFSPFLEYDTSEAKTWLKAAVEGAYQEWPDLLRSEVKINATLPRVSPDRVPEILAKFPGCATIKIKIDDFEQDHYLVEAALEEVPDAMIRLDVNGGWSLQQALLNLHDYHLRFGKVFEYVEQPCLALEDLRDLKAEIPIKIAVDESIRKNLGSDMSILRDVADVAIVKWAPSGGIAAARELIESIGLPAVVSSALDTGIGISHAAALAASLSGAEYACGLGTVSLLMDDVVVPPVVPMNGIISVGRVTPSSAQLHKYRASPERHSWWQNRITSIWNSGLSDEVKDLGWLN